MLARYSEKPGDSEIIRIPERTIIFIKYSRCTCIKNEMDYHAVNHTTARVTLYARYLIDPRGYAS